ncbi:regulating synaptic membrane exocytosis protein 2 isoform X1 [Monomorium pharaonis]|uniref:regulating synaptic membrane exocytosis protein 2 isoform X1 n=2 Tax=Monomorium pharaonis TaxID=307658 RepID=UPI00063EEB18|nr:regulating synaptic membrane exocytosis protein 2 isoform X1 [Monomorium pharaonis]
MAELPQPDMSHLTPEERRIIEGVLMRQKEEEEQDHEIMRRKQDEVQILEETIRMRSEKHKKAGVELNATCHICLKTKFADGVGHICNYCDIRCCARCGGKVTLRSSKVIWVCILCRKKQELLSKTGQWMAKTGLGAVDSALLRQMQEDLQVGGRQGLADQTRDKRPKLERAHSAAEKENLPLLQRSGNCPLRRQYSQQEQISGRRMSTSDSGVEMSVSPHARTLPTPHVVSSYPVQQTPRHPAAYPDDDPNLYRGELDGLMRQHPPNYQRQRSTYQDSSADLGMTYGQTPMETGSVRTTVHPSQQHSLHQTQGVHPVQPTSTVGVSQQRSFSSSEEERSTPECASDEPDESEKGKGYYHHAGGPKSMSSGGRRHNGSHNGHHGSGAGMTAAEHNGHHPPREPRKEESTLVRRSFRRCGDEWRADSRRFTEKREKKTVRFDGGTNVGGPQEEEWSWEADRQGSQDSATKDSGIDTSSTFTSSEDSNRGDLPKHPSWQVSEDGQKIIGHMILRKSAGTGSCSSILGLKVVGGKLLEDGSMGALIEKVKKGSTADVEGHLRPGDEVIAWNGRSLQGKSFREVYDIIAESRLEPQIELVVERKLSSTTTGMAGLAGPGPSTPMASRRIVAQSQWRQKHETISGPPTPHHKGLKKCLLWELYDARREKPSVLVTSPGSPDLHAQGRGRHSRHPTGNANVGGSIQVKLGYDLVGLQLIVTIICASGLTPKSNGQPRNPYAKVFLLPDKSEKSKRRTKTVANTNDPRWNQTFVYNGVRRSELKKRALEITVWDYARYEANDFLGETVLELAVCLLDEEPEWHSLTAHGEHRHVRHYQDSEDMIDCHLSPPSTTSRLSDSDTSECDITDYDVSREQRRTADGASISSIGSSSRFHNMPSNYKRHYSSPPPERELYIDGEHRSRRDMSPQGRKRAALMISRDQPASISSYQTYRKDEFHRGMMGHRSHSAAPMDSPSVRYRGRSQSPTGHRSLSPPEHRSFPYSHGGYVHTTRFGSRSATATPTGSPKKRQLPQIPAALKERVAQDFEERARFMRHRNRQSIYRSTGMGGWEKHYSGLSDSDLPSIGRDPLTLSHSHAHRMHRSRRGHLSPDKDVLGGDLGDSDMESIASVTSSAFSTQSERPRGSRLIEYTSQSSSYEKTSSHRQVTDNGHNDRDKRSQFTRSLSNADVPQDEKDTGSFSDTAIALNVEDAARRGRKSSPGSKSGSGSSSGSAVQYQAGGLGKKSNSTSQLSATECGGMIVSIGGSASAVARTAGLASRKRNSTPGSIQRSEEVMPAYQRFDNKLAGSAASDTAGSLNSISSSEGSSWSPSLRMAGEGQLRDFIEDLGPGQVVGRQALGARCLGEIQLSLSHTKGYLEVEVIRAKDLKAKQGSKVIPAPYVKLYLVNGKRCIEKAKTTMARKTLDPFYQQLLAFKENCRGCILQVTVWGDYGRIEGKKVFMGIAQIVLDELDLSQMVFGWYKLFDTQALVSGAASLALSRRSSVTSLDSFKI